MSSFNCLSPFSSLTSSLSERTMVDWPARQPSSPERIVVIKDKAQTGANISKSQNVILDVDRYSAKLCPGIYVYRSPYPKAPNENVWGRQDDKCHRSRDCGALDEPAGTSLLGIGEWMIKKMPLVSYVYSASKQISGAISPDQNTNAFKEVAIIKHPRVGEYALGFITSTLMLQKSSGAEELCCVYVPTNHLYLGDIFLVNSNNIMRPNLSVREAIEIVISGGLSIPKVLTIVDLQYMLSTRVGKFSIPEV
nr:protein LIKE COV 1-like [Ipomoea trifida]